MLLDAIPALDGGKILALVECVNYKRTHVGHINVDVFFTLMEAFYLICFPKEEDPFW